MSLLVMSFFYDAYTPGNYSDKIYYLYAPNFLNVYIAKT